MASKKDSSSGNEGGGRVAQRRPGRNRQVRRIKEVASVAVGLARTKPDKAQAFARSVPRQSRGLKQQRTAAVTVGVAQRPSKISIARRVQVRQFSALKVSEVEVSVGRRIVVPKIDSRRRAQVSQRSTKRLVARSSK